MIKNNRGFTIFEILIAITILSFMMFGIVSISTDSLDTKDRVLAEDREMMQVESAFSIFLWDFAQIYSPLFFSTKFIKKNEHNEEQIEQMQERYTTNPNFDAPDKDGLPIPFLFSEEKGELQFFTASNRRRIEDQKASNFAWVKYKIVSYERDQDNEFDTGNAFARYYSAKNPFGAEKLEDKQIKPQILLKRIKELKFEFWHPTQEKFVEGLDSIPDGRLIIRGLKLSFTWIDKTGAEREEARIFKVNWPWFDPSTDIKTDPNAGANGNPDDDPYGNPGEGEDEE